ncbi:MAG TPA: hypothetical protein VFZ21_27415 [Gemmatimonadaceae bacterium]|nr:hypothetical protein [Gemmatimonadaceae bacterium]
MSDLLDYCATTASWSSGKCAEVRVGNHVTRYVRRGSGLPVIVVGANANDNAVWAPLVESLAGRYRLVIPQTPGTDPDMTGWLRSFIEGIGLTSVALVAGGQASGAALAVAAADDFTVRKLVLVTNGERNGRNTASNGAAPSTLDRSRMLYVAPEWQPAEAVERIERFISASGQDA